MVHCVDGLVVSAHRCGHSSTGYGGHGEVSIASDTVLTTTTVRFWFWISTIVVTPTEPDFAVILINGVDQATLAWSGG
jgi:hypothetical protein